MTIAVGTLTGRSNAAAQSQAFSDDGEIVRVGVVAYEDSPFATAPSMEVLLRAAAKSERPLRLRFAVGTYGDVEHWMHQGLVDLVVATPGLFSDWAMETSNGAPGDRKRPVNGRETMPSGRVRYLATVGAPPATGPFAPPIRKEDRYHDRVFSLALVSKYSSLRSVEDLVRAAHESRLRCLLVHPLSVSGSIAPQFALHQRGVDLEPGQIEYTHSHSASVATLLGDAASDDATDVRRRETVAFVWDDALHSNPNTAEKLRILPFPELDALSIPQEMIVARDDFSRSDEVARLLIEFRDANGRQPFSVPSDWQALRGKVLGWQSAVGTGGHGQSVTLDEIGRMLLHFAHTQPKPPRLALVLSGRGAKCSYQAGAVSAIEEELARLRTANPDVRIDIDLVVGTSGGAINAVPIALGVTSSAEGRAQFCDVWRSLDQRDIVRPSGVVRANIGLWFALLQLALVLFVVRRAVHNEAARGWWIGGVWVLLGLMEIAMACAQFSPWQRLGTDHVLHHAWLWLSFGAPTSAWGLIAAGAAMLLVQAVRRRHGRFVTAQRRAVGWLLAVGLFGLPLVQIVTVLFFQDTLSGGDGMQHALAEHYPSLFDGEVARRGLPALALERGQSDPDRLQAVARELVARNLLHRDLVITGSRLESDSASVNELPSDLYFYLPGQASGINGRLLLMAPPFGRRGIALAERPEIAMDVVLGSGSIYPVSPSRRLRDFPAPDAEMELVDGGFAHNSPIEAAVLWGATHIVLIEASPPELLERSNFVSNAAASFAHLYEQSQLLDARSRGKVAIFTLAPSPPHLCVLDFANNLIEDSIARGYQDASGRIATASETVSPRMPRFRKELGEPVFMEVNE